METNDIIHLIFMVYVIIHPNGFWLFLRDISSCVGHKRKSIYQIVKKFYKKFLFSFFTCLQLWTDALFVLDSSFLLWTILVSEWRFKLILFAVLSVSFLSFSIEKKWTRKLIQMLVSLIIDIHYSIPTADRY